MQRVFYLLILSTFTFLLSGCTKGFDFLPQVVLPIETPKDEIVPECIIENNRVTNSPCKLNTSGKYIYTDAYGGRSEQLMPQSLAPTAIMENGAYVLKSDLPKAWSDGLVLLSLTLPSTLIPGNIRSGVNIFGVNGSFVTTQKPACNLAGGGGLQPAQCLVPTGHYNYSAEMNGRSTNCTLESETNLGQPCWINTPGTWYLVAASALPAVCVTQGLQSTACRARVNQFYYSEVLGGRNTNCASSTGVIRGPCWLTVSSSTDITFMGGSTASSCVDNATNALQCLTNGIRWVYTSAFDGRAANCTNNSTGLCFINTSTKQGTDTRLVTENIKSGVSIFGMTGSFGGENMWNSGVSRDQGLTPLQLNEESGTYAASTGLTSLPIGNYEVPKITISDDGYYNSADPFNGTISPVDRSTWGTTSCGLTAGSLTTRAADCATKLGANSTWDGATRGHASQSRWVLITRVGARLNGNRLGQEVWLDTATGMKWSSLVSLSTNWCKASGSNNSSAVSAAQFKEDDSENICDDPTYQATTSNAISACFEAATGFTATDTTLNTTGKAGLSNAQVLNLGKINWRLPTMYDYDIAEYNGIRFVLPDMGVNRGTTEYLAEWTATVSSESASEAWVVDSSTGAQTTLSRSGNAGVRCIGR